MIRRQSPLFAVRPCRTPARTGVLFGAERTGLTNEAVTLADAILSYPVNPKFASLNLAQAVAVFAHGWAEGQGLPPRFADSIDAPATREDGSHYEIKGMGGSWFRYAGDYKWSWQRDFFDFGNAMACFMELIQAGKLGATMQKRIERVMAGEVMPGHVKHAG